MRISKILLFGSTGMLGNYMYSYFSNVPDMEILCVPFRIIQKETTSLLEVLEKVLVQYGINTRCCVMNCIGLIPQRKPRETPDTDYFLVNGIFPHVLWMVCKKYGAKMIQPSTDCVFTGKKGGYTENDIHDETSPYGMSKSVGEPNGATIIRTSIIGRERYNKKSLLEWVLNSQDKIYGWKNHRWNGITCLEYCKLIETILRKNSFWTGVRHVYSPTAVSKYELVMMIVKTFELQTEVVGRETEDMDKTLGSLYPAEEFHVQELEMQLRELAKYEIII